MPIIGFSLLVFQYPTEHTINKLSIELANSDITCGDSALVFTTTGGGLIHSGDYKRNLMCVSSQLQIFKP